NPRLRLLLLRRSHRRTAHANRRDPCSEARSIFRECSDAASYDTLQNAHIVLIQHLERGEISELRSETRRAEPERESAHLLRIVFEFLEHVAMHHARSGNREPAGAAAQRTAFTVAQRAVNLRTDARFGVGIVLRHEAYLRTLAV